MFRFAKSANAAVIMGTLFCAEALAQAGPAETAYIEVLEERTLGRPVVHMFGDSIFRGKALIKFPDEYTRQEIEQEPLWPLRSPISMMRIVSDGGYDVGYGGGTGLPASSDGSLRMRFISGDIIDEDIVVIEDAGYHSKNSEEFYENLMGIRRMLCEKELDVIILNTYEDMPTGWLVNLWGVEDEDIFRWDKSFDGMSMNDAYLKATRTEVANCRPPHLIDVDRMLTKLRARRLDVVQNDEIHPTVTGQWAIALALDKKIEEILASR